MSETKSVVKKYFNGLIVLIIAAAIVYFVIQKPQTAFNVLLVLLGFGAVIMIHEFGHFIVAKLGGIKVEAFSIGFPPTLLGIQRLDSGLRIRFLPKLFASEPSQQQQQQQQQQKESAALTAKALSRMTAVRKHKPWDTEYCIGLIPFGGYVKMLGQEDTGAAEVSDDPRSFMNKPISIRIAVVAAGVIFNAISAFLIFMIVFLAGMQLPPAVIGDVRPNSPAERAGLRGGDRIIQIADKGGKYIDFTNIILESALSDKGQPIDIVVRHPDKTTEELSIISEAPPGSNSMRSFGISPADSRVIAKFKKPEDIRQLYETTGLRGGDVVTAFNGIAVEDSWQLKQLLYSAYKPTCELEVRRTDAITGKESTVTVELPLYASHVRDNFMTGYDFTGVYSMIPRLKIVSVPDKTKPESRRQRLLTWVWKNILRKPVYTSESGLEVGDVIMKIADTDVPTYNELLSLTKKHENRKMAITVLRKDAKGREETVTLTVTPTKRPGSDRVTLGIVLALDTEHPVIATTMAPKEGVEPLNIPRGAIITFVDGEKVSNFYDVIGIIKRNRGQRISLDYRIGSDGGGTGLNIPAEDDYITVETDFVTVVPENYVSTPAVIFEPYKEFYKADNPAQAIGMSLRKTHMLIEQTYLTLKQLVKRNVSPKALAGPVGIISISYKIASYSIPDYIYFLGLISAIIAVMNLLPLPIVDGGVIILLIIEKLRGKALSEKVQEIVSYAGLVIILALFVWLTFNDLRNLFFG